MNSVKEMQPPKFSERVIRPYKGLLGFSASPLQRLLAAALVGAIAILLVVAASALGLQVRYSAGGTPGKEAIPVNVTYRGSILTAGGYVAQFHNSSNKFLRLAIKVESPTMGVYKAGVVEIPAFGMTEIGWAQGWKFASGDKVTATEADHAAGNWTLS